MLSYQRKPAYLDVALKRQAFETEYQMRQQLLKVIPIPTLVK